MSAVFTFLAMSLALANLAAADSHFRDMFRYEGAAATYTNHLTNSPKMRIFYRPENANCFDIAVHNELYENVCFANGEAVASINSECSLYLRIDSSISQSDRCPRNLDLVEQVGRCVGITFGLEKLLVGSWTIVRSNSNDYLLTSQCSSLAESDRPTNFAN